MNLLMKGAALAPPFSCTTKYSSDVYSPRPPDIRVRLLPTKPPVHFTTEQPGRDNSVDRRIAYDKSTISSYKRVLPNDFILHLRSFEGGLEIVNEEGVVSPAYTILRARNEIIPLFFYTFFRSYWFINSKLRISVEGIRDGKSINMNTFWHIKVPVPSIEEQRHISALISSIDNRIKIAEFEYKRLLQIRVGLMQQLFI